jgi:hypothetical protein
MSMQAIQPRANDHAVEDAPMVLEFTGPRARTRPLATRAGGIEVAGVRLPIREVNIERQPDLRRRYRVELLPTYVVVRGVAELARFTGPYGRRELAKAVYRVLDPALLAPPEPPQPRGVWNEITSWLWGFKSA